MRQKIKCYGMAFAIPILVMVVGFAIAGVYPFGGRSALVIDGVHQYLPFFTEYYRQLKQGASLFYSWAGGLGYNFFAVWAYYLSSPLNLLVLLFKEQFLNEAVTLIMLIKVGLSAVTMTWYLKNKRQRLDYLAVAFGLMYALSNYVIGYSSNVMWLDCMLLLPVAAEGIERIVRSNKGALYGISMFAIIASNYYVGFIVCMFACMYFIVQLIARGKDEINQFIKKLCLFGGYSLLAGGTAAMILLPSIKVLGLTAAAGAKEPLTGLVYSSILQPLSRLLFYTRQISTSAFKGDVNIYCGVGVFLFFILYMFNKRINKRERAAKIALLGILYLGFCFQALNLILHGMHKPVGFPNRYACTFQWHCL